MTRNAGTTKGAKKKADDLFSRIVRSRGACEKCGRSDGVQLQCAHIISRRYNHTRCVEGNAFCLCAGCHAFFTDHPVEFTRFVLSKRSEAEYEALLALSRDRGKIDWPAIAASLALRFKELAA